MTNPIFNIVTNLISDKSHNETNVICDKPNNETNTWSNIGFSGLSLTRFVCNFHSVVDSDPSWFRFQDLCGSGSRTVFLIRILTGKYRINYRQNLQDLKHSETQLTKNFFRCQYFLFSYLCRYFIEENCFPLKLFVFFSQNWNWKHNPGSGFILDQDSGSGFGTEFNVFGSTTLYVA